MDGSHACFVWFLVGLGLCFVHLFPNYLLLASSQSFFLGAGRRCIRDLERRKKELNYTHT